MDDSSNAPKFHMDRSRYGESLLTWFEDAHPDHTNVSIGEIDIPVATDFQMKQCFLKFHPTLLKVFITEGM